MNRIYFRWPVLRVGDMVRSELYNGDALEVILVNGHKIVVKHPGNGEETLISIWRLEKISPLELLAGAAE